jgi:hypothetical protein
MDVLSNVDVTDNFGDDDENRGFAGNEPAPFVCVKIEPNSHRLYSSRFERGASLDLQTRTTYKPP